MKHILLCLCCLLSLSAWADEGMWMLGRLDKQTRRSMKELGLSLSPDKLYHPKRPSLKDAVVSFGGFCSGVVVSEDGLVFTNHHCGFSAVRQHSSVEHDYLTEGFVAHQRSEELPNPELYVRFLLSQTDVTQRVLGAVRPGMDEAERAAVVDSVCLSIGTEVSEADSTLTGVVDAFYGGNEFWLSVYRDYDDVRLVYAPPASVGKFGWDTDNWMWPRHTGDFCVFRIYADAHNRPASYSPDNVPYRPAYVAPVSLKGYREGSFCMTLGYPGTTDRYLSSFGVEERMESSNRAQIEIRGVKQDIWKRRMNGNDTLRIKYASKYDESSNYWKNSIGMNRAIDKLHVIERKQAVEQELRRWIRQQETEDRKRTASDTTSLLRLLPELELAYKSRRQVMQAQAYFIEAFLNGPELVKQALSILNFDFDGEPQQVIDGLKAIVTAYDDMDVETDKEVFAAMLQTYRARVSDDYLPDFYHTVDTLYGGDATAYAEWLYEASQLDTKQALKRILECDSTYQFYNDPAITLSIDLLTAFFQMNVQMRQASEQVERGERLLNAAIRRMYASRHFYPDANSTMRLSFGTVCGYTPADGVEYGYYTTSRGIIEKVKAHAGDRDFAVQPALLDLLSAGDFGRYADEKGEMKVCFISNNDITGGNSGSAMFNAKGELLGLAFDGNWEAMSSDLLYEPRLQRTVGVDVRYMLFIMEKYGKATHLIEEILK